MFNLISYSDCDQVTSMLLTTERINVSLKNTIISFSMREEAYARQLSYYKRKLETLAPDKSHSISDTEKINYVNSLEKCSYQLRTCLENRFDTSPSKLKPRGSELQLNKKVESKRSSSLITVLEVDKKTGLIVINRGSNHDVKLGSKYVIFREHQAIASATVCNVRESISGLLQISGIDANTGDKVKISLN